MDRKANVLPGNKFSVRGFEARRVKHVVKKLPDCSGHIFLSFTIGLFLDRGAGGVCRAIPDIGQMRDQIAHAKCYPLSYFETDWKECTQ